MALSPRAEKYKRELRTLADNLPFKVIERKEFRDPKACPAPVRQKRTYLSPTADAQAIGRFLMERGVVNLLTPEQTNSLFTEIHWAATQIRMAARRRFRTTAAWRNAVIRARRLISQIEAAEEEIFIANRRLVVSCIKPYFWIGQVWLSDFLQEGSKALSNAIRKFDFTRGTPFYVYAQKAVTNRLRNYFRDHVRSGSIGLRPSREMLSIKEILDAWPKNRGKPPGDALLARLTGLSEQRVKKIRPYLHQIDRVPPPTVSLDALFADNDASLYDVVEDRDVEQASHAAQRSEIWSAVDRLPPRSKLIMRLRFIEGRTLEETGALLNLTRARIKQIQDDALRKLRQMLRRGVAHPNM